MSSEEITYQPVEDIIVSIEVNGEIQKRNLTDDLKVTEDHINEHLKAAPGIIAWWYKMYEISRTRVLKKEVQLERVAAELDVEIREDMENREEKITDVRVQRAIQLNKRYQAIQDELLDMKETLNFFKFATKGLEEKRSTLISLSSNMRSEIKSGYNKFGNSYTGKNRSDSQDNSESPVDRLRQLKKDGVI
jgi:hypothetical protein